MTDLENNLRQILTEKQNKIIPENIKEGTQIFDVIGTFRGDNTVNEEEVLNLLYDINGEVIE